MSDENNDIPTVTSLEHTNFDGDDTANVTIDVANVADATDPTVGSVDSMPVESHESPASSGGFKQWLWSWVSGVSGTTTPARPPLRIALGHQMRVGKDEFAKEMVALYPNTTVVTFAEPLYVIAKAVQITLGKSVEKDRLLLQTLGASLKKVYGDDIFAFDGARRITEVLDNDPSADIVVTDMRHQVEMNQLKDLGFSTVKITRENRETDGDVKHVSETEWPMRPSIITSPMTALWTNSKRM